MNTVLLLALTISLSYGSTFYSSKSGIINIKGSSDLRKQLAKDNGLPWIIEFYAPWCGHCKSLKPEYLKLADRLRGIVNVAAVDCDDEQNKAIAGQYGVKGFPTLKLIDPKTPSSPIDYQQARTASAMYSAVLKLLPNHVVKVASATHPFFDADSNKLVLFTEKEKTTALFQSLSAQFHSRGIKFAQVHKKSTDLVDMYRISKFPSLVMLLNDGSSNAYDGTSTAVEIAKWLEQYATAPSTKPFKKQTKSESKPSKNYSVELTTDNFGRLVLNSTAAWMLEFYAPWCGHCKSLAPHWKRAADSWKGIVKFGAIDCDANPELAQQFGIQGFPTIKSYSGRSSDKVRGVKHSRDYSGERTAPALSKYAEQLLPNYSQTLKSAMELDGFMRKSSTDVTLALVTSKAKTPALMKALALEYQGIVDFAVFPSSTPELLSQLIPDHVAGSKLPKLVLFTKVATEDGNTQVQAGLYNGPLAFEEVSQLLSQYSSSKRDVSETQPSNEPSELIHLSSDDVFKQQCVDKLGLCVIAFPYVEEGITWGTKADYEDHQGMRAILEEAMDLVRPSNSNVRFLWTNRLAQASLVNQFRLTEDAAVAMIVIQGRKMRYAPYIGAYSSKSIQEFVDNVLRGKVTTIKAMEVKWATETIDPTATVHVSEDVNELDDDQMECDELCTAKPEPVSTPPVSKDEL